MKVETPRTKEIAGETHIVSGVASVPLAGTPAATTLRTIAGNFDAIKHLLSDKPVRRPNRTRPAFVTPKDWKPADEATLQSVRQAIEQARLGKFSQSPPDIDADADLADRCEDLE